MAAPAGSILPPSYFDGLSQLWGACAYAGSAIVSSGFVLSAVARGHDPLAQVRLLTRVFLIGIATLFLREWLMRLNDIVSAFGALMDIDPTSVDDRFVTFISGLSSKPGSSVWDVIWGTGSIGTAISYSLLWLFGWLSWGVQYLVKLVGDILLSAGWAVSPLFLSLFLIRPMAGVAFRYVLGLAALVCWPFGWVMAAVVTNAMLDAAAKASLIPVVMTAGAPVAPVLTVLLLGTWMLMSSVLAPYVITRMILTGANPGTTFAQGGSQAAQAALVGGVGAAGMAATGGAAALGLITASVVGGAAAAAEVSVRGGGSASTTAGVKSGLAGFYGRGLAKRQAAAFESMAGAFSRMAGAAESMASSRAQQAEFFREQSRHTAHGSTHHRDQPHVKDPNAAAIDIESYAKNSPQNRQVEAIESIAQSSQRLARSFEEVAAQERARTHWLWHFLSRFRRSPRSAEPNVRRYHGDGGMESDENLPPILPPKLPGGNGALPAGTRREINVTPVPVERAKVRR